MKILKKIIAVFILIIAIYVLLDFNLKLPTEMIKLKYLIVTPINTNMSDVEKYLQNNNYKIRAISNFRYTRTPSFESQGSYYIRANIGNYRWLFARSVIGIWIFDEDKKLIEIIVRKEIDAL